MTNWITMESFGDNLPENWEEIAAMLNAKLEAAGVPEFGEMTPDEQDAAAQIWEDWCNG